MGLTALFTYRSEFLNVLKYCLYECASITSKLTIYSFYTSVKIERSQQAQNRHTTSKHVNILLNYGCNVGGPKFYVNSMSNVNVKLMSNTDVS